MKANKKVKVSGFTDFDGKEEVTYEIDISESDISESECKKIFIDKISVKGRTKEEELEIGRKMKHEYTIKKLENKIIIEGDIPLQDFHAISTIYRFNNEKNFISVSSQNEIEINLFHDEDSLFDLVKPLSE